LNHFLRENSNVFFLGILPLLVLLMPLPLLVLLMSLSMPLDVLLMPGRGY